MTEELREDEETGFKATYPLSTFPTLSLKGGPHGRKVEALLDGEKMKKVSRIVIDAGVNDAVRIITYQFAELDVVIEGQVVDGGSSVHASVTLYQPDQLGGTVFRIPDQKLEVTADTPWEALRDVARQLELAAQGVAQAGTI